MKARMIKTAGLLIVAAALSAPIASAVVPNDRAGTQGVGQTSADSIGMGGLYGLHLIQTAQASSKRDVQAARTFRLPLAPDDRPGTTAGVTPALVIPYLSQGIGVTAAQLNGSTFRPGSGWVPGGSYSGVNPDNYRDSTTGGGNTGAPISSTGNDFNWGSVGFGAAGFAALALAIALLAVLARRGRHGDVAVS